MPQKRNPYALAIVRGASGVLIGRLTGFLAVTKSPSARSDNLIFAYGEVPRALDLSLRITRLMGGVVRTLRVNPDRMREELDRGYTQATDLAEHLVQLLGVDYRTAYVVVGNTVRAAGRGRRPRRRASPARCSTRPRWPTPGGPGGSPAPTSAAVLDPRAIVASRQAEGGAARRPRWRAMIAALRGTCWPTSPRRGRAADRRASTAAEARPCWTTARAAVAGRWPARRSATTSAGASPLLAQRCSRSEGKCSGFAGGDVVVVGGDVDLEGARSGR